MTGKPREIPYEDIGTAGFESLVERHRVALRDILRSAGRIYTGPGLWLGDRLTRTWLERASIPYREELQSVVKAVGMAGAWMLNFSYEWGCSAAAVAADGKPPKLLRTMDWYLPGLGRTLLAVQREGAAGEWVNFTWPGFIGVIQGLAPGRFALCLNQAPPPDTKLGVVANWAAAHARVWRSRGMPPALLARLTLDTERDFASALRRITETPLCTSVFITLIGCRPGEAVTVERTPSGAVVHREAAITNHWLTPGLGGPPTAWASEERLAAIRALQRDYQEDRAPLDWLESPVLSGLTRVALEATPATGDFCVQGWEPTGPGTAILYKTLSPKRPYSKNECEGA